MDGGNDIGQSGGVIISGRVGSVGGDIVGRDKVTAHACTTITEALAPIKSAIASAPQPARDEAAGTFETLSTEVSKGKHAEDGVIARLLDSLVDRVPGAASAVVGAFASPILTSLAGPVTKFVLERLSGQ